MRGQLGLLRPVGSRQNAPCLLASGVRGPRVFHLPANPVSLTWAIVRRPSQRVAPGAAARREPWPAGAPTQGIARRRAEQSRRGGRVPASLMPGPAREQTAGVVLEWQLSELCGAETALNLPVRLTCRRTVRQPIPRTSEPLLGIRRMQLLQRLRPSRFAVRGCHQTREYPTAKAWNVVQGRIQNRDILLERAEAPR